MNLKEKKELFMSVLKDKKVILIFDECLHKYLIKDAISDDNVLGFGVEYVGRYREKNKKKS